MAVPTTCRQEILAAAEAMLAKSGQGASRLCDLVEAMRRAGTRYSEASIIAAGCCCAS